MRFLTTKQISGEIEGIIRSAGEFIILISPFLKISDMYLERLTEAGNKKIKIGIVYGKSELSKDEEYKISSIKNVALHFMENLHAKCYMNEKDAIITSMNLYEYSENNREMGIFISKETNTKLYGEIYNEAISIIKNANKENISAKCVKEEREAYNADERYGHCIRCNCKIFFDPTRPFCGKCYSLWANYQNIDYNENFCHMCGEEKQTTMRKSLCGKCFEELCG